jgi:PAS domain S-box-containing protein
MAKGMKDKKGVEGKGLSLLTAGEQKSLLALSRELICLAGMDGYFKYLNPAWESLLGYTLAELYARPFLDFIHPEDHDLNDREIEKLASGQASSDFENRYLHKNGSVLHISWVATPLVDQGLMLCMGRDITQRVETEERLKDNLLLLRIAGEMARLGGWSVSLDEDRCYWSDETAAIHEMSPGFSPTLEEGIAFYAPEWRDKITEVFSACARDGIPYDEEMEIINASGRRVWVQTKGEAVRDERGHIYKVQGAFQDISERKRQESKLAHMVRDWQATFDASSDAIFVLDAQQRVRQANLRCECLFGIKRSEMIGRHCWEIVHGTLEPLADCPISAVQKSLRRESTTLKLGEEWYEINVDPVVDEAGIFTGAIHMVSDITLRKWTEDELLRGKERLERLNAILQFQADSVQALLDHALEEAIYITRSKIGYVYHYDENKQTFTLNSWSRDVMPECRVLNQRAVYELDKTGIWGEAVRQRRPIMVNDFTRPDPLMKGYPEGHVHLSRFLTVPVFMDQRIVAVVGVANKEEPYDDNDLLQLTLLMDAVWKMVERRRAQEEMATLEDQFRQVQKLESIGRLAGGVAHDFNNMLCIILGYAEGLKRELPEGSRHYKDAYEIAEAARRSAALTRQLLAFSRRQALQSVVLDPNALLLNIEKMLRRLIGEDIVFELSLEKGLWLILADPGQIEQVVMNLAVNARDAMPQGGRLLVETFNVQIDHDYAQSHQGVIPGRYVMISVTDSGSGMTQDVLDHIFEPFFTTKKMGEGTGLGLATVYGIVKQSGGNIWVYSEPGQGTTFKIYLPVHEGDGVVPAPTETGGHVPGTGQLVMVVDDEPALQILAERVLTDLGYQVVRSGGGEAALGLVEPDGGLRPKLLITDVIMPGMNGLELYDRMRAVVPGLKVLFMSGYTDSTVMKRGAIRDGLPFLAKPFNTLDLSRKVESLLKT